VADAIISGNSQAAETTMRELIRKALELIKAANTGTAKSERSAVTWVRSARRDGSRVMFECGLRARVCERFQQFNPGIRHDTAGRAVKCAIDTQRPGSGERAVSEISRLVRNEA
jgi:hypothetical protein